MSEETNPNWVTPNEGETVGGGIWNGREFVQIYKDGKLWWRYLDNGEEEEITPVCPKVG